MHVNFRENRRNAVTHSNTLNVTHSCTHTCGGGSGISLTLSVVMYGVDDDKVVVVVVLYN